MPEYLVALLLVENGFLLARHLVRQTLPFFRTDLDRLLKKQEYMLQKKHDSVTTMGTTAPLNATVHPDTLAAVQQAMSKKMQ